MLPCLPSGEGSSPALSCQDEASASRATPRMTTMVAAAAVEQVPWQEARALCLKTVLSGRSRAGGPRFCRFCCGWRQEGWRCLFTPVRMLGARMLPSLPTVSTGPPSLCFSEQEVGRSSFTQKPGRKRQGCKLGSRQPVASGQVWQCSHLPQAHASQLTKWRTSVAGQWLGATCLVILPPCSHEP